MIFRLNLYITIKLITFIRRNWVTQVLVETVSFYKIVTCNDIGTLANSQTYIQMEEMSRFKHEVR